MNKKRKTYTFEFWATPKHIAQDPKLNPYDKMVLSSLITRHNGEGRLKVKQETISRDWSIGIRSVQRSLTKLEKLGYVERMRLGKKLCNQYEIHPNH